MKKILMAVVLVPMMAVADTETVDGVEWTYYPDSEGAWLQADGAPVIPLMTAGAITIPETLGGKPVKFVGSYPFDGCYELTSVTIPSSVRDIGGSDFRGCSGLKAIVVADGNPDYSSLDGILYDKAKSRLIRCPEGKVGSVTIPSSVRWIAQEAFYHCRGLKSVTIPSSVTQIEYGTFSGCSGLTSVSVPSSVTSIKESAFYGCSGLSSVTIPSSVTSIDGKAFKRCCGLASVTIPTCNELRKVFPDSYKTIREVVVRNGESNICNAAFYGCSGLRSVTIPSSVTSIGASVFVGCSELTSVTIPESVTRIERSTFSGCSGLTSVTIPVGVTKIGEVAFFNCSGLKSVTIPSNVTEIDDNAFEGCKGLQAFAVADGNKNYSSHDGILYNKAGTELIRCPEDKVGSVTIPLNVISIADKAFQGCGRLTSVAIPAGVTKFSTYGEPTAVFSGCRGLTAISVDAANPFYCSIDGVLYNKAATSLEYCPEGRTKPLTIPASVTSVGRIPGHSGPAEFAVADGNSVFSSHDGILYNKTGTELIRCPLGKVGSVTIPSGVTSVGDGAFRDCSGLTAVTIPSSVASIGDQAFYGCNGLKSVTIPSSVMHVGNAAFRECSGLTSVRMPDCLTELDRDHPFAFCSGLKSVTIPSNVTDISHDAFDSNSGLREIVVEPGNPMFSSEDGLLLIRDGNHAMLWRCPIGRSGAVTIPSNVIRIAGGAFDNCDEVTSVTCPPCMVDFGDGFRSCGKLTSLELPGDYVSALEEIVPAEQLRKVVICPGTTRIRENLFLGCRNLTSVTIPESVTDISRNAFWECESLQRVYFQGNAPRWDEWGDGDWYCGMPGTLVSYVRKGTTGWLSETSTALPDAWRGRAIAYGEAPAVIDGVEWEYQIVNGKVIIASVKAWAEGASVSDAVTVPAEINGHAVTKIGANAFAGLSGITSVVIPASVRTIESGAFADCDGLDTVTFLGDAPYVADDAFSGTKSTLAFVVPEGSIGWSDASLTELPGAWKGHAISYVGGSPTPDPVPVTHGTVAVTNVVVHYILNSVKPEFAISPSSDMGFVNIITEVKSSGIAAIPMSWAFTYPDFVSKFGSDFTAALGKPTGKVGADGTPMLVWHDYVAGTDPTKEDDVFTASITIVDSKVTISYSPELDDARKALRKYTTWGKKSLMDTAWTEVPEGHEAEYNFFKVSVEMR